MSLPLSFIALLCYLLCCAAGSIQKIIKWAKCCSQQTSAKRTIKNLTEKIYPISLPFILLHCVLFIRDLIPALDFTLWWNLVWGIVSVEGKKFHTKILKSSSVLQGTSHSAHVLSFLPSLWKTHRLLLTTGPQLCNRSR
jgi:hypothetical protein